jgi:hypothetical protein
VETFKGLEGAFSGKGPLKWKFKGFRGRLFWEAPSKVGGYLNFFFKKALYFFIYFRQPVY